MNSVNFVVDLFKYFGIKINFAKSSLIPSQTIDFLGYSSDARKCRFTLTQDKLFKCRLIIKCLSRIRSSGVKLLQRILGFLNFALQLFPLGRSFIRRWYKLASNFVSSRVKLDPSPLVHLRDVFFKGPLFAFWPSGVAQPSLPCFVDATPSRVAGISGQGGFAFFLHAPHPIFEAEFLASFYGIGMYQPISNNIHLTGDNLGVLFCLKRGSSRNLFANEILKYLAYLWSNLPFFLNVSYIKSEPTNHQIINNSFHASSLLSLNDDIVLDKTEIFKSLLLSKSLVEVNLCNRPTSTQGESTSVHFTRTVDSERFQFDDEMDMLMQDFDHQKFKINLFPSSGDFPEDLSHELKFSDSDQALLDLFDSASQKNDVIYQEDCQFDFTAGHLFSERLQEFGMKNDILSYVKSLVKFAIFS